MVGDVVFSNNQATARFLVESMNNPGTLFAADSGQAGAVIEKCINQSVFAMTCPWMNDEAGWLVDYDQIIVFEDDLQRDLLWHRLELFQRRFGQLNLISTMDDARGDPAG